MNVKIDKPKTVAIDFDGVIAQYQTFVGDKNAGEPVNLSKMVDELNLLNAHGWKIIVWTNRADLNFIETYLHEYSIPYDAINSNPWAPNNVLDSRKIHADVYIDDKAVNFRGDWHGIAKGVMNFDPWWFQESMTGLSMQELDAAHNKVEELTKAGHTRHCAKRIVWGDGECECVVGRIKPNDGDVEIACKRDTIGYETGEPGDSEVISPDFDQPAQEVWDNMAHEDKAKLRLDVSTATTVKAEDAAEGSKELANLARPARPHLPMEVCGYHVDQVALFTTNIFRAVEEYQQLGFNHWLIDEVRATQQTGKTKSESNEFRVKLAFNYDVLPGGVEFELLQLLEGQTAQLPAYWHKIGTGLSHYGFHVEDMDIAIAKFAQAGYRLMSTIRTNWHSSAPNKYRYAYMDTRKLGFVSKLIIKQEGE